MSEKLGMRARSPAFALVHDSRASEDIPSPIHSARQRNVVYRRNNIRQSRHCSELASPRDASAYNLINGANTLRRISSKPRCLLNLHMPATTRWRTLSFQQRVTRHAWRIERATSIGILGSHRTDAQGHSWRRQECCFVRACLCHTLTFHAYVLNNDSLNTLHSRPAVTSY